MLFTSKMSFYQVFIFSICPSNKDAEKGRSESPARSSRKHKLDDRYAEVEDEMISQVRGVS